MANQPQGNPNAGRRFNPVEIGVDLLINLFESYSDDMEKRAGWDMTGIDLLGGSLRGQVKSFLSTHQSLLPFLETSLKTAVLAAFPNMPPEARSSVNALLDLYTDGVRDSLKAPNDDRAEVVLMDASSNFKTGLKKVISETEKQRAAKPSFEKLLMDLPDDQEKEMTEWIAWIPLNSKQYAQEWIRFRSRIGSKEVLQRLCLIQGEPVPIVLIDEPRRRMEAKTEARMSFLEGLYGLQPTVKETVAAFLAAEETPYTKKIIQHLDKAKHDAVGSIAKSDAKIAAVKARSATIVVPVAHRNVALIMIAVLLACICVLLYIIMW